MNPILKLALVLAVTAIVLMLAASGYMGGAWIIALILPALGKIKSNPSRRRCAMSSGNKGLGMVMALISTSGRFS